MHPNWIVPFLAALARGSSVSESAAAARISSSTAYKLRREDADFAEAWRLAIEDSTDILETEARRRAIDGVEEPVVYQGQLTPIWERDELGEIVTTPHEVEIEVPVKGKPGEVEKRVTTVHRPVQARKPDGSLAWLTIRKPSDSLLALLLKGRRKDVFADRTELTGADGGPVKHMDESTRAARVAQLMAIAAARADAQKRFEDIA